MTPEQQERAVRALVWLAPAAAILAGVLGAMQGATPGVCLLLGAIMFAGCLLTALLIHLRGSAAEGDAKWIVLIVRLLTRT